MVDHHFEKNPRWIDGRSSYRKLAFNVYGIKKICSRCGAKKDIDIHHRDENPKNNVKENLEPICGACHNSHHKKGKKTGKPSWNKGIPHSVKTKKKISLALRGEKNGFYGKKWEDFGGHPKGMLGKKHSKETIERIRQTMILKRRNKEASGDNST